MKKFLVYILFNCLLVFQANSQAPLAFNYQAIARDNIGVLLKNQDLSFRISITYSSPDGPTVYSELQNVKTNQFGMANFAIGRGAVVLGNFSGINWSLGNFYIKVELATNTGGYQLMGASSLLSVPYALFATKSANPGPTGPTGPTGPILKGANGLPGPTGPTGLQGIQGVQGIQGTRGLTGYTGFTGPSGLNGVTGSQGIQGVQGIQGIQGIRGLTGVTGPSGINGINGTNGVTGPTGLKGVTGSTGITGPTGIGNGTPGATGPTGPSGTNGINGTNGLRGVTGPSGINGTNGVIGPTGATGLMGPTGPAGTGSGSLPVGVIGQTLRYNGTSWVSNGLMYNDGLKIGIGTTTPQSTLDVNGIIRTNGLQIDGGSDLAEPFEANSDNIKPGMLLVLDPENPGKLMLSNTPYDTKVVGVVSGANNVNPGLIMNQDDTFINAKYPVALSGRVYCYADATIAPIKVGDMLTTSDIPGFAMKVTDFNKAHGAIIGKAMTNLANGQGFVLVFVSIQ